MRLVKACIAGFALGLTGLLGVSVALAQETDYGRPGAYFQVGGLVAISTSEDDLDREIDAASVAAGYGPVSTEIETGGGVALRIGYRLHRHFASEAQFEYATGGDIVLNGVEVAELSAWMLSGNLKAYAATGRFQPYALIGGGAYSVQLEDTVGLGVTEEETDFGLRVGGGFDVYLSPTIALTVEPTWVMGTGEVDDLDYVAINGGLLFRF